MDTKETPTVPESSATGGVEVKPDIREKKPSDGPKMLDLAFGMDCTGSMGSYIASAQQSIRDIVEEIVSKESADIRLALVEYRDHPPQDHTFVTRVHQLSPSVRAMKQALDASSAEGGGDGPEAVADALQQLLKLDWRPEATKICVLISDAPPHGLDASGDGFPNGCPDGLDPMEITQNMSQKDITLYCVGCEPSINRYKPFFQGMATVTGGQYVPLSHAKHLAKVIVGGAQEEMSLRELMEEVNKEVEQELAQAQAGELSRNELARRIHTKLADRGYKAKKVTRNAESLKTASKEAKEFTYCTSMNAASKLHQKQSAAAPQAFAASMSRSYSASPPAPTAEAYRKKSAAKEGGFMSGLVSYFTGSSSTSETTTDTPEPSEAMDFAPMGGAAPPMPVARAASDDVYTVEEDADVSEEQVWRMVQRNVAQQGYSTLLGRDSDCSDDES